jgi:hypothetical protein
LPIFIFPVVIYTAVYVKEPAFANAAGGAQGNKRADLEFNGFNGIPSPCNQTSLPIKPTRAGADTWCGEMVMIALNSICY